MKEKYSETYIQLQYNLQKEKRQDSSQVFTFTKLHTKAY